MVTPINPKQLNARDGFLKNVTITSAQLLAINTTPITVLTAPVNTANALILSSVYATHAAGTAYASVNDLTLKYTNGSGVTLSTITASGFLDSASAVAFRATNAAGLVSFGAPVVITCGTGNPTTGTFDVKLRIKYRIERLPAF
jgi:hypothetical protein